jgi:predicted phosphodiesterase
MAERKGPLTNRTFVISDAHVPFHRKPLLEKVCRAIRDTKPDGLVLAGDFLDLYSMSTHVAGSLYHLKDITLGKEYEAGNTVLDKLDKALGKRKVEKHYIFGNHEDRYFRWVQHGDNAKVADALGDPATGLQLKGRGYKVHQNWRDDTVRIGRYLDVVHGTWCSENSARKHLAEYQSSVMFGHTHRAQTVIQGQRGSFNIGGLFDKDSKGMNYVPRVTRNKWCNGFAVVDVDSRGYYYAQVVQAFNDSFVLDGKLY